MFIQILTKTILINNEYVFTHTHYLDDVKIDVKRYKMVFDESISKTDSYKEVLSNPTYLDLLAECYNVGRAFNEIIESDTKFGVKKKHSRLTEHLQLKMNEPKQWLEYLSGEKRFAAVYTDSQETYRNVILWHSIPNHYLIRCYERLLRLKNNFYIALRLTNKLERNY